MQDAVLHTPGAAFALVTLLCETGSMRQPFDARARIVTADPRQTGIYHVTDSRNGQRRFGDVGRNDDLAARRWREDTLLIAGTEPAKQRNDFRFAVKTTFQLIAGFANVTFARHEDQHVARVGLVKDAFRGPHRCVHITDFALLFGRQAPAQNG